jgi:tetratricopeptide (TPR) repeat protein
LAEAAFKKGRDLAKSKGDRAEASWQLGRFYNQLDRHEEAIVEIRKANALEPAKPWYYFRLMGSYIGVGRGEEGLAIVEEAAEAYPHRPLFHYHLGMAYYFSDRYVDAVGAYKQALRLGPGNGDYYYGLGWAYAELDSFDLATSAFRAASRLGVRYSPLSSVYQGLANVRLAQGLYGDLAEGILEVIRQYPDDDGLRRLLGVAYACQGRYDRAADELRRAAELNPNILYNRLFYSLSLYRVDRADEARANLRSLAGTVKSDPWEQSLVDFVTGELDEAGLLSRIENEELKTELERKCEAYYYIGMAYILDTDADLESSHPDTAKARGYFEQCLDTNVRDFPEYHFARAELARLPGD